MLEDGQENGNRVDRRGAAGAVSVANVFTDDGAAIVCVAALPLPSRRPEGLRWA